VTYTPDQARDWCYAARTKPLPLSSCIPIMQSLADQVERLTDENIRLRTPKAVVRRPQMCMHHLVPHGTYGVHCQKCGISVSELVQP